MNVHEYNLKLSQLLFYAREMVAAIRSRIGLFVSRLSRMLRKKGKTAMLIGDVDIASLIIHVQ